MSISIKELSKIKYFRHIEEDSPSAYEKDDPLSCVFKIISIDENKKEVVVEWLDNIEDEKWTFPWSIFDTSQTTILDSDIIDEHLRKRAKLREKYFHKHNKELCKKIKQTEKEKAKHFSLIKPKIQRNTRVFLVGGFNRALIDFTTKEDVFYVDDVTNDNGVIEYSLRTVGLRKNRGIYVFRTKYGFLDGNLLEDTNDDGKLDYDYRAINGVVQIARK